MKRINISRDVESRQRIANGLPLPIKIIEKEVKEIPEEDAKSEESEGPSTDTVQPPEKPAKKSRTTKGDV